MEDPYTIGSVLSWEVDRRGILGSSFEKVVIVA